MLLTELEAADRWCPRMLTPEPDVDRRDYACVASACMAWRWGEEEGALSYDPNSNIVSVDRGPNRKGFCGLACVPIHT